MTGPPEGSSLGAARLTRDRLLRQGLSEEHVVLTGTSIPIRFGPENLEPSSYTPEFTPLVQRLLRFLRGGRGLSIAVAGRHAESAAREHTALQLAIGLAQHGREVILVDADFATPGLNGLTPDPHTEGLIDMVRFGRSCRSVLWRPLETGPSLLAVGSFPSDGAQPFEPEALRSILHRVSLHCEAALYVAPLAIQNEINPLVRSCDHVVYAVQDAAPESGQEIVDNVGEMQKRNVHVAGVVLYDRTGSAAPQRVAPAGVLAAPAPAADPAQRAIQPGSLYPPAQGAEEPAVEAPPAVPAPPRPAWSEAPPAADAVPGGVGPRLGMGPGTEVPPPVPILPAEAEAVQAFPDRGRLEGEPPAPAGSDVQPPGPALEEPERPALDAAAPEITLPPPLEESDTPAAAAPPPETSWFKDTGTRGESARLSVERSPEEARQIGDDLDLVDAEFAYDEEGRYSRTPLYLLIVLVVSIGGFLSWVLWTKRDIERQQVSEMAMEAPPPSPQAQEAGPGEAEAVAGPGQPDDAAASVGGPGETSRTETVGVPDDMAAMHQAGAGQPEPAAGAAGTQQPAVRPTPSVPAPPQGTASGPTAPGDSRRTPETGPRTPAERPLPSPAPPAAEPPESASASAAAPSAGAVTPPSGGAYTVHVGSYRRMEQAYQDIANLQKHGFEGRAVRTDLGSKGLWYRVYVGSYPSKAAADGAREAILKLPEYTFAQVRRVPQQ